MEFQRTCKNLKRYAMSRPWLTLHSREGYIPPRRPYGFDDMMADVLEFAFDMLVENGRLSVWMPTANDEDIELAIPMHPGLELISVCVQQFNKCKPLQ